MKKVIGKYGSQPLTFEKRGTHYIVLIASDNSPILGLTLNYEPILSPELEIEDDTIYLNNNDKLKFKRGLLSLISGRVEYVTQYSYRIGNSLDVKIFDEAPYKDYLFSACPVNPSTPVKPTRLPQIRKLEEFEFFASHYNGSFFYKVGNLIIGGLQEVYLIPEELKVYDSFRSLSDFEYIVESLDKKNILGPFVLTQEGLLSLLDSRFTPVNIEKEANTSH